MDAGYRGEIRVTLLNTDTSEAYSVAVGDRIAQLIVQPVTRARFVQVERLARQRARRVRVRVYGIFRSAQRAGPSDRKRDARDEDAEGDASVSDTGNEFEVPADAPSRRPPDREVSGPLDDSEANAVRPYVDLGGVKIVPRNDLQLRLEVEEGTQRVVAVAMDYAGSTLQVQPFAAPRTSGLWAEIRDQIVDQIQKQGGTTRIARWSVRARGAWRRSRRPSAARAARGWCDSSASTARAGFCAA